jgi:hypothetical protein
MDASDFPSRPEIARVELALADEVAACYADPLRFVLLAFEWGEGELAGHDGPDLWQRELLAQIGAGVLTVEQAIAASQSYEPMRYARASGHGIGKSAFVAWLVLWAMSTRPNLAGVVTANTSTQLETKTWRELSVWHKRAINAHWFVWTATKFYHYANPETWYVAAIAWSEKRSEAFAGLHGEHVLLIFDEASAIPDAIWDVAEGAQTTGEVLWCVFGNPTRNSGRFRECFGKLRHRWNTGQVDSRTARMANQSQIAQWIADYGEDSDFVRIRARGVFPRAGTNQFIASDEIEAAQTRPFTRDTGAPLLLGVDVARFGGDQSVMRYRRGRDARSIPARKFRGVDTMNLASYVVEAVDALDVDAVFIDGGGVGGGVVDRVRSLLGKRADTMLFEIQAGSKARNDADYSNRSAECWGAMREWVKTGAIDDDIGLRDDLTAREYGFDAKNRIQLESKDDMSRRGLASPDDGDALALTFAEPVGRRDIERDRRDKATKQRNGRVRASGEGAWMG